MRRRKFFGLLGSGFVVPFLRRPAPAPVTYAEMERAYEACVTPGDPIPVPVIDNVFKESPFLYAPIEGGLYKPGDPFVISRKRVR